MKRWSAWILALTLAAGCTAGEPVPQKNTKPQLEILGLSAENRSFSDVSASRDPGSTALLKTDTFKAANKKNYTLMIYMIGSNLESRFGAATNDIQEILDSGISFDNTNVLLCAGGSRRWNTNISNRQNSVLDLSRPEDEWLIAETDDKGDMAAADALAEYLAFCTENYPADHYGLIFWDHGGGPLWGYGADELFGNDTMILEEIRDAMDRSPFAGDQKLDFVGFDACLMGSLESAFLWQNYADYMVASEEVEAGDGWDYAFLSRFNESPDTETILQEITQSYASYYEEKKTEFSSPDATLAAYDLKKLPELIRCLDECTAALQDDLSGKYAVISQNAALTKGFGMSAVDSASEGYDLIDLYDWTQRMGSVLPEETADLCAALDDFIVTSVSNVDNANGVSIYFPRDNKDLFLSGHSYYETVAVSEGYSKFLNAYSEYWLNPEASSWDLSSVVHRDNEILLTLSPDQLKDLQTVYYTVLERYENYGYIMTLCNVHVDPDADGTVHIPEDPELIVSGHGETRGTSPWMFIESERTDKEIIYRSLSAYLCNNSDFSDLDFDWDEPVNVILSRDRESGDVTIQSIKARTDLNGSVGKNDLDMTRYYSIYNWFGSSRVPTREADGTMKPFYEWESAGLYGGFEFSLDDTFYYEMRKASETDTDYSIQILAKDIYGNVHAGELIPLTLESPETFTQATDSGRMQLRRNDTGLTVVRYTGEDTAVEIPASVNGIPVTQIGAYAFSSAETVTELTIPEGVTILQDHALSNMSALEQVHLPESLRVIGARVFYGCRNLASIQIPDGVEDLGHGIFGYCTALTKLALPASVKHIAATVMTQNENFEEYTLDASNPYYTVEDGILYTKDKKALISCPGAKEEVTVAAETEEIAYGAFNYTKVRRVTLPEGLKKISNCAFFGTDTLEELILPESLEYIGSEAFSAVFLYGFSSRTTIPVIRIGKNVSFIGDRAFNNLKTEGFEVDEANSHFASAGGFITSRAKDTILVVPLNDRQVVEVPDGITTLTDHCFENLDEETEFILPDSLFRIPAETFPYGYDSYSSRVFKTVFHCSEGSAAEAYAKTFSIPYDDTMDITKLVYETVEVETDEGLCTYQVYSDRAVLTCYEGDDTVLELPETVNDVPLTEIRMRYSTCFRVETLKIPASVTAIDAKSLREFYNLKTLDIQSDSFLYEDGILYSKGGKELIAAVSPSADVVIHDGCTEIQAEAFYNCDTEMTVHFPSSLRTIGNRAFYSAEIRSADFSDGLETVDEYAFMGSSLEELHLPSTLKHIGQSAFASLSGYKGLRLPDSVETVGRNAFEGKDWKTERYSTGEDSFYIGPKASVEVTAFNGLNITSFTVAEDNENYSAEGPFLLSKDGRTVLKCAQGVSGTVTIPDHVETLGVWSLDYLNNVTDIYIPASVTAMTSAIEKHYSEDETYPYIVHVYEGSEAAYYVMAADIPYEIIPEE